ncbi:MAG: cytochrome c-type biogenesis CcmF C-terminal domain-containing protein, partial [Thermoanaerobaculia bacterium]|nr:cytochrome c-type biogenesis CcmF C-terminal domain-containing protein [Thermoanaerobaculia bacterium]
AVPVFLALLLLIGVGPALPWGSGDPRRVRRALLTPMIGAAAALGLGLLLGARGLGLCLTLAFAGYALWVTFDQALQPARRRRRKGEALPDALRTSAARAPRRIGAYVVHFGVVVTFLAIAVSSSFQVEQEAALAPGESMRIRGYELTFQQAGAVQESHRIRQTADVALARNGRDVGTLAPSINHYETTMEPLATPAVRTAVTHDLYLTLMNVSADGSIGLRAIVTPAVVWIWVGVLVMVAGTGLCLVPPARARAANVEQAEAA